MRHTNHHFTYLLKQISFTAISTILMEQSLWYKLVDDLFECCGSNGSSCNTVAGCAWKVHALRCSSSSICICPQKHHCVTVKTAGKDWQIKANHPTQNRSFWRRSSQPISWLLKKLKHKIRPIRDQRSILHNRRTVPTSKSHDTKTRSNIKNPARQNIDIVP